MQIEIIFISLLILLLSGKGGPTYENKLHYKPTNFVSFLTSTSGKASTDFAKENEFKWNFFIFFSFWFRDSRVNERNLCPAKTIYEQYDPVISAK